MNFSFKVAQIRSQEGLLQNEVHLSYECNLQNIFVFKGVIPTRSEPYFMLFPMQNVSVKALQGLHKMRDMPFIWLVFSNARNMAGIQILGIHIFY